MHVVYEGNRIKSRNFLLPSNVVFEEVVDLLQLSHVMNLSYYMSMISV